MDEGLSTHGYFSFKNGQSLERLGLQHAERRGAVDHVWWQRTLNMARESN